MVNGYGNCRKRSWTLGGYFFCIVNENANCSDKTLHSDTGYYASIEACKHENIGMASS